MKNTTTFRLKGKKNQGSYILTRGMARQDGILKAISYRPGASSIYDEENKKSAARRKSVVFKYNERKHDPAVEIVVPNSNGMLLKFLMEHQDYKKKYDIYDENQLTLDKVAKFEKTEKALALIGDGGDDEIKAAALAVFGLDYFTKPAPNCKVALKEKAINDPQSIISVYSAPNFYNRYLVSLLYCNGIIKNNGTHTAVQWAHNDSTILVITTGENGIDKLTEFISRNSTESELLLQDFQSKADLNAAQKKESQFDKAAAKRVISDKDKEIEELKKQLAAQSAPAVDYSGLSLEEATTLYKEKKGKDVPTSRVDNLAWILAQLSN